MGWILLTNALLAAGVSLGVAVLVWKAGVMDVPGNRSMHTDPTPRGGAVGLVAAAGAVFAVLALLPVPHGNAPGLLGLVALMGALGACDDVLGLSSRVKFAVMTVGALVFAGAIGVPGYLAFSGTIYLVLPPWIGLPGAALFLFVVINAVNFMDGSDGMLAAGIIPGALGLVMAGLSTGHLDAAFAGVALAGGLAGFLVLNRAPARVFAGDGGSLSAGALYAGGALALAGTGLSGTLWLAPLFVLPFLADVLLTMARRAAGGRLNLEAHREHLYQRLIAAGWSHSRVALGYAAASTVCVMAGLLALTGPEGSPALVFVGMAGIMTAVFFVVCGYAARRRNQ